MKQTKRTILSLAAALSLSAGLAIPLLAAQSSEPARAGTIETIIHNTKGEAIGRAILTSLPQGGVKLKVVVTGLKPGKHGMHFHAAGVCQPPDFKSAGDHFNPAGKHHGLNNPEGPHAGDLPNLSADQQGRADVEIITNSVTLEPGKLNSLLKEGGTSLVVHEQEDDQKSDPSGNSGARIACGAFPAPSNK